MCSGTPRVFFDSVIDFYGNTAQSAFGISWKICALISSLFLEVHKVHLRIFFHKSLCFMESKFDRRISTGFDIFFIKTL